MGRLIRHTMAALLLCAAHAAFATPATDCRRDLDELPGFMLENDAGGKDLLERQGAAHLDAALAAARAAAAAIESDDACGRILSTYLQAWRHTHLGIEPVAGASMAQQLAGSGADPRLPTLRVLSRHTLLLTLRSFNENTRDALVALLKARRHELQSHPDWIVDVRDNDGGMDSSFAPLVPWLLGNGSVEVGVRVHVTPANIAGWERVCAQAGSTDPSCAAMVAPIVQRMKAAQPGDDIAPRDDDGTVYLPADPSIRHRPQRVAVLVDRGCGSSCEQFLLAARQGFGVKLVGRHTYGGLDYSNLRTHDLPSGRWRLWYATTRSLRVPDQPVDGIGVLPDVYLPAGQGDEVERTRRWLEGGSLAPAKP